MRWPVTLTLLALAILASGGATLFIVELWLADRVMPGVYVWDVDLGSLHREEAAAHLASSFEYPVDRHPILRYEQQTWPVTPGDLGTELDVAATVEAALAIGHEGTLLERLEEQILVLLDSRLVVPVFRFEPGAGTMFLSRIAREINRPLHNAGLVVGEDLAVEIVSGQTGRQLDQEATRQALAVRIEEMVGGEVQAVFRESAPLLTDLGATQEQVRRILGGPITLTAPDSGPWIIEPATLAEWLILQPDKGDDGKPTLSVSLNPNHLTDFAQDIASEVNRPAVDAQFRFDDASGALVTAAESVPGRTLDITSTVALIEVAATGDERTVALPLVSVPPEISSENAAALGIVELIAEGKTSFAGSSAARIQNITVGAAQFDGLLIAPGETFSFNHYLGEVTAEKGYEEGIIIWGNTTRADVGGGLCQVSSTAFRAAFWAGVPIAERWAHAFRVSYYEPPIGLDATIYSPQVDLKWVNDTGHYILIQTYVDKANARLSFRFYGTDPGRTVEMDGPHEANPVPHGPAVYRDDPTLPKGQTKQIEWAKDGLDVTIYRIIKEGGVEVQRDTFFSRYRPWQAVYLVGTKEE
ncbi:MAG: VanW family protein [Anaerolineae bacterium]|nr:VanW family protein [Anaerolineae bacterium]